jgi:hypothetical protein
VDVPNLLGPNITDKGLKFTEIRVYLSTIHLRFVGA